MLNLVIDENDLLKNQILLTENNSKIGIIEYNISNNNAIINFLSINPQYQGLGLTYILFKELIEKHNPNKLLAQVVKEPNYFKNLGFIELPDNFDLINNGLFIKPDLINYYPWSLYAKCL